MVPIEQLQLMVKPLPRAELEIEAEAWFKLLRNKARQIAAARIGVKKTAQAATAEDGKAAEEALKEVQAIRESVDTIVEETEKNLADKAKESPGGNAETSTEAESSTDTETPTDTKTEPPTVDEASTSTSDSAAEESDADEEGENTESAPEADEVSAVNVEDANDATAPAADPTLQDAVAELKNQMVSDVTTLQDERVALSDRLQVVLDSLEAKGGDITPILAAIGATRLVVGLALQGTLSNFASGLMILINRPFDVGDVVTAGGVTGTVNKMNLVSTTFRTFDNQTIHVPNNEIWNNVITNITATPTRRVDMEFGTGYSDDFEKAETIIQEVVAGHELILDDPQPVVVTHALADSSINIVCRPWAKTEDWWQVKTDVVREVKRRFDEAKISIPFPQQDIHVHSIDGRLLATTDD